MRIRARKISRCVFPPIGSYISNLPFKGKFEDLEIKDPPGFKLPIQIRPDGARQPQSEASVIGNIRTILQGRAGFPDADILNGGYK